MWNETIKTMGGQVIRFAFQTMDAFVFLKTGHSHILLSKRSLLIFNNVTKAPTFLNGPLHPKLFATLMVFLNEFFFEKAFLRKRIQQGQKE